jgi:hypothetical protein
MGRDRSRAFRYSLTFFSAFTLRENGGRIVRADRTPEIEPSSMKDAFQTTMLVIARIDEAVAQIMQIRGEPRVLFRVMREQFL